MRVLLKYHNGSWKNETAATMDSGLDMDATTPSRDVTQHLTQDETVGEPAVRQPEVQIRKLTKNRPVSRLNRNRPEFAASLNRTMPSFPTESGTPKKGLNTSMKRRENRNKSPEPAAKKRILTEDLPEERLVIEEPKDSSEMADSACDLNQTAPAYRQQPVFMARPPVPFSPSSWYHMYPPSPYVFYGGYPYQQLVSHHFTYESPRNYMYRPPMPHPASSSVHPSAFLPSPPTYLHYHQPSPARFHGPAAGMPLHSQTPVRR